MKTIIVYHAYLYGRSYMELMAEQWRSLIHSGLYNAADKIYIGIVDTPGKYPENGIAWANGFYNFATSGNTKAENKVEIVVYPDNMELRRTLWWIRDYAKDNPDDYILFFHAKGITCKDQPSVDCAAVTDWRRYMEYFVIERWKDCIQKLDEGYDACGVMWNSDTSFGLHPHFSGAFYWVKGSYINTLDNSYLDGRLRYDQEFWIGTNPDAKIYEFHNSRFNDKDAILGYKCHYQICYPKENYI